MPEDEDIDAIIEELEQENEDNVEDRHAEVIEEAEEKADREDPVTHQLRKDVKELTDKFNQGQLQSILDRFDAEADEVEKTLFKNIRAKIKSPERALEAIAEVRELAAPIREQQKELMSQAEEKAANVWGLGSGPLGKPSAPTDHEKELMERISRGDTRALVESVIGDDLPF